MKKKILTGIIITGALNLWAQTPAVFRYQERLVNGTNLGNVTLNITACGGTMSGGGYTSTGSLVPVGGQDSKSASFYNYSGFAAGFILQPGTACNVLPDELNPDNDGDGLLDSNEIGIYGTSPVLADTDGDGMNDAQELIAGTSPTNSASVLAVQLSTDVSANQVSWYGVSGRYYRLEYTDDLANGWTPKGTVSPGANAQIMKLDVPSGGNRFYRIRVSDNPSGL